MVNFLNKYLFWIIAISQIALFFIVKNDPFHGDAVTSCARVSLHIYENNLKSIWYEAAHDPGHPTLFPFLLASAWLLFGKSLVVSHAFVIIVCFFILIVVNKIASIFVSETKASLTTLACGIYSIFVAQNALLLNTPLFYLWVFLCIYFLFQKRYFLFSIAAIFMELTHLQANFFLLAFAIIYIYQCIQSKATIKSFVSNGIVLFLPAMITLGLWGFFHYQKFGWTFLSPNYAEHDDVKEIGQFIKSFFLIIWRILDNGMLIVYAMLVYFYKKQKLNKNLLAYSLIILLINAVCMGVFLYNTIGHRYFMVSQFLFIILLFSACDKTNIKRVFVLVFASLAFGNWMYYPGKVIADTNLQYRSFFELEKLVKNDFDTLNFYSYAPISTGGGIRYLDSEKGLKLRPLNEVNLDTVSALIQSNINAEFTLPQKEYLYKNWYGHSYENGAVFVNVFLNPNFHEKPSYFKLRELSDFEIALQKLKFKIRGE